MSAIQFEGDLTGVSEKQESFIRDVIDKLGFNVNKVVFEPVGKTGDNYVANVKRIIVTGDGKDEVKIIAKIAPQNEMLRVVMNTTAMFTNEIVMYEEVLPKFASLEDSVSVPKSERLRFAKCFGCFSEVPNEVLLLEDLRESDYVMLDRFVPLENDAVKLSLKNLAVLHSLSFVLNHQEPEIFESYKSRFTDIMGILDGDENFKNVLLQTERNTIAALEDEKHKKVIEGLVSQWLTINKKIMKYENPKNFVIQQGDGWTNNIMFRLEEGKVLDSIMIDYQLSKVGNPVYDILYMVFNCTDHAGRSKHYNEWIDYYHEQLDKNLSKFGLKANLIYSQEQLVTDLKRYSKSLFCINVLLYGMLTRNEQEAAMAMDAMQSNDLESMGENISVSHLSKDTLSIFRSKVIDLIDSYREFGYIA